MRPSQASSACYFHAMEEMNQQNKKRFGGIARLYGQKSLAQFQKSKVLIVGLGGVGSWIVEGLARSGVGHLGLMDLDEVCVSNTNRQIQALQSTVGQSKGTLLLQRCKDINPLIQITEIEDFLDPDNVSDIFAMGWDMVIDATDSLRAKVAMILEGKKLNIPVLTIGGAGGQIDPTQIKVADLSQTTHDPLASQVRYKLRHDHGYPRDPKRKFKVPCVYSTEQLRYPTPEGETCAAKPNSGEGPVKLDCANGFGASMPVTCTFAMVATAHTLSTLSAQVPT